MILFKTTHNIISIKKYINTFQKIAQPTIIVHYTVNFMIFLIAYNLQLRFTLFQL